jgi:hypothetical protein
MSELLIQTAAVVLGLPAAGVVAQGLLTVLRRLDQKLQKAGKP